MNKLMISRNAAVSLAGVSAITRIFFGTVIDRPELYHAGWISIITGGIITFPLFMCLNSFYNSEQYSKSNTLPDRLLWMVLAVSALLDSAITARCISNTASYTAFNHAIRFFLLLPLFIAVYWSLFCGGDAAGYSARLWTRIFPLFFAVIIIMQCTKYRWTWLTPILGPGAMTILDGAIDVAGWISASSVILLFGIKSPEDSKDHSPLKLHLLIVIAGVTLVLMRYMMAPALVTSAGRTRIYQLDIMLTNGRANLFLQLPLIIAWFISLFYLLVCDCFIAAAGIKQVFPKLKDRYCHLLTVTASAALSMSVFSENAGERSISGWLFAVNATAGLLIIMRKHQKGRINPCGSSN